MRRRMNFGDSLSKKAPKKGSQIKKQCFATGKMCCLLECRKCQHFIREWFRSDFRGSRTYVTCKANLGDKVGPLRVPFI